MKKLILTAVLILVVGTTFGQTLKKGNLIGTHVLTINLVPDVTMNQFMDFFTNKVGPEFEKNFSGIKTYVAKGIRGENENSFGVFYISDSVKDRDKYWNEDGTFTELGNSAWEKVQPTYDELQKLGTLTRTYTDWVIH